MIAINDDKQPNAVNIRQHLKNEDLKRLTLGSSPCIHATMSELIIGPIVNVILIFIIINIIF